MREAIRPTHVSGRFNVDEQPVPRLTRQDEATGPRVLALHPTSVCAHDCDPCFLKHSRYGAERPLAFFAELVRQAGSSASIREIALAVNLDPPGTTRNRDALAQLSEAARSAGLKLGVTTNYENVRDWGVEAFSACHHVALSVDEYKFPPLRLPGDFFEQVTRLQAEGVVTSLNVLLSHKLLDHLTLPRLRRWLGVVDQVNLIIPKHHPLDFSRADLLAFFERIAPIWEEPDRFFHLQLDNCIKPEVFPWNQLQPTCDWAERLVNVLPDGGLSLCAMDAPQMHLNGADSFLPGIEHYYLEQRQVGRSRCPFIRFQEA
jgi:hypothetical protein